MLMRVYELRGTSGIDSIELAERTIPAPGPDQVLIRVRAVSLNHSDLTVTRGAYRQAPLPLIPCSDGAGEVTARGQNVTRVRIGDRVASLFMPDWISGTLTASASRRAIGRTLDGMLAEYVVANEQAVVRVPEHLSNIEASTLPTAGLTAWNATTFGLQEPEWVLTLGTGGVSLFAMQFALQHGSRVIATSSQEPKLERLRAMGASHVINYTAVPDWEKEVRAITQNGADRVIEVGGAGTLERSLRAVRVGGRISLIGAVAGRGQIDPLPITMKAIQVEGIYVGSREMFEAMNAFISQHSMRPIIDRVFDFTEAKDALRYLESGRHFGKICIRLP